MCAQVLAHSGGSPAVGQLPAIKAPPATETTCGTWLSACGEAVWSGDGDGRRFSVCLVRLVQI